MRWEEVAFGERRGSLSSFIRRAKSKKKKTRWPRPIPFHRLGQLIDTVKWYKEIERGGPTWKGRQMLHPYEIEKRMELALQAE